MNHCMQFDFFSSGTGTFGRVVIAQCVTSEHRDQCEEKADKYYAIKILSIIDVNIMI